MKTNPGILMHKSFFQFTIIIQFHFLFLLGFSFSSIAQQGIISAEVSADSVTVWHIGSERNCATVFGMEMTLTGNHIKLLENDLYGDLAYCMCNFDLSAGIGNLTAGDYTVDVYSREAINNWDTVYWGSTFFTILNAGQGPPQIISEYQSDCYVYLPPPTNIELEVECNNFSFSTSGKAPSDLLGFNLYINDEFVGFLSSLFVYYDPLENGFYHICITAVYDQGESEPICWDVEIPYGDPVADFHIEPSSNAAILSWSTPDGNVKDLSGFHIFRDFELLTPSIVYDTFFVDENIAINTLYQYYVTAIYDSCESLPSDTLDFLITGVDKVSETDFQLSPNPVKTILNVHSDLPVLSCQIFNLIGEKYINKNVSTKDFHLDVSDFPEGIYLFQIATSKGLQTKKIIVR